MITLRDLYNIPATVKFSWDIISECATKIGRTRTVMSIYYFLLFSFDKLDNKALKLSINLPMFWNETRPSL